MTRETLDLIGGSVDHYDPDAVAAVVRAASVTAEEFAATLREIHRVSLRMEDANVQAIYALAEPLP